MDIVKALILICSANLSPSDCTSDTARAVINGPEVASGAFCGMQGQAFLAQTALGEEMTKDEYLKMICRRSRGSLARAGAPLPQTLAAQRGVTD